jgi:hypothetical protein
MEDPSRTIYTARLALIRDEAASLATAATKVVGAIEQAIEQGGTASIQSQMAFLAGEMARMTKDWGVVEYLQAQGVSARRPMRV